MLYRCGVIWYLWCCSEFLFFSKLFSGRKTIKVLFSKEEAERRCFLESSPDFGLVLSKFDALENKSSQRLHSSREVEFLQGQNLGITFTKLIFIVLSVLGIVMVSYCKGLVFEVVCDVLLSRKWLSYIICYLSWTALKISCLSIMS